MHIRNDPSFFFDKLRKRSFPRRQIDYGASVQVQHRYLQLYSFVESEEDPASPQGILQESLKYWKSSKLSHLLNIKGTNVYEVSSTGKSCHSWIHIDVKYPVTARDLVLKDKMIWCGEVPQKGRPNLGAPPPPRPSHQWKRISLKRMKNKTKNDKTKARNGKDKVKSKPKSVKVKKSTGKSTPTKSKVNQMKKIQLEGLKLPNLKLYYKNKKARVEIANWVKYNFRAQFCQAPKVVS
ncbi:hypothetical protein Tco_0261133 [Tanacetum coccineum]